MSSLAAFRQMVDANMRAFSDGLRVTLRRTSTLKNRVSGKSPATLSVAAAALAGAAAIDLTGTSLDGELVAGATFTIAGNPTVYTTTTSAVASLATNDILEDVGIAPVLAQNAAQGAVVTLVTAYADEGYGAMRVDVTEGLAQAQVEGRMKRLWLSALGGPRVPRRGDILIDSSESDEVVEVAKSKPGSDVGWLIQAGAG